MTFESFCKKNQSLSEDASALRQQVADNDLTIFATQQVHEIIGKDPSKLIAALTDADFIAEVQGKRHTACEYWQQAVNGTTDQQCQGCGEPMEKCIDETRFRWKAPLPGKTPTPAPDPKIEQNFFFGDHISGSHNTVKKGKTTVKLPSPDDGHPNHEKHLWERIVAVVCGVALLVCILLLAVFIPNPTPFQYTTFRIILALAAGGFAGTFSGFLDVTISTWIRAGGGLAVFVIVYFYATAKLGDGVTRSPSPQERQTATGGPPNQLSTKKRP